MELFKAGNEHVLVVDTSLSTGPAIMPTSEAEITKGRLIVLCLEHKQNSHSGSMTFYSKRSSPFCDYRGGEKLSSSSLCSSPDDIDNNSCDGNGIKLEETEAWNLRLAYATNMRGIVLALCPYLDCYFLASAGSSILCYLASLFPENINLFWQDEVPSYVVNNPKKTGRSMQEEVDTSSYDVVKENAFEEDKGETNTYYLARGDPHLTTDGNLILIFKVTRGVSNE
ncbi:unnamed protein product [Lactuca saligna]|uniref:Uncharacterized protein n=1 Tax=Lactuca saligna TaxID=75948 RepID=A0AA35ZG21_LACSI|nr:unnamed protein product [Lactuca saligna]